MPQAVKRTLWSFTSGIYSGLLFFSCSNLSAQKDPPEKKKKKKKKKKKQKQKKHSDIQKWWKFTCVD